MGLTPNPLDESLVDLVRRALVGYVTDPVQRTNIADAFRDGLMHSTAYASMVEVAPSPEALADAVARRRESGWTLVSRESSTRAVLTRNQDADLALATAALAGLDDVSHSLRMLLDYSETHRCNHREHDHDCHERWRMEKDYAVRSLTEADKIRMRGRQ